MADDTQTIDRPDTPDKETRAYIQSVEPKISAGMEESLAKREAITADAEQRLRSLSAERTALANQGLPRPPHARLQNIPKAPQENFQDTLKVFQNPAIVVALLGSVLTRTPLTTALNAGGAAMEAFHKGDKERMENERTKWKDNLEAAIAQNGVEQERYREAWNDTNLTMQEKLAKIQAIAAASKDEVTIAGLKTGNVDTMFGAWEERMKAVDRLKLELIKEQTRIKLDPAIANQLAQYPGLTIEDMRNTTPTQQTKIIGALQTGDNLEVIAKYARDNPEAIGIYAQAAKQMNADRMISAYKDHPLGSDVVNAAQGNTEKLIDDGVAQGRWSPTMAAKAKILGKMLTTQAFADAASAGSRGATIYLDKAFKEIYDQGSTPEAFLGIMEARYDDANRMLKLYNMGFDNRLDKNKREFWSSKAEKFWTGARGATGFPIAPTDPKDRKVGTVYQTPRGPLEWTGIKGSEWKQPASAQPQEQL